MKIVSLGYLRVESPDAKKWARFGPEVLGLMLSNTPDGSDDTIALTPDDRPGRIQVDSGERNRLACLGWEVAGPADFHDAVNDLKWANVEFSLGTDEDCARARVRELVRFTDPAGHTHEIFWGQLVVPLSFHPGRPMSGFVTGGQGLGHVVLLVPDLIESVEFFTSVLCFAVTDEIDLSDDFRMVFLRANPRHHSVGLAAIPGHRGMHHMLLQARNLDDVGVAYDKCLDEEIPLAKTLGRHSNDRMVSFYVRTPSGFEIEYGWGAVTVDDESAWVATHMKFPSMWGHRQVGTDELGCIEPITSDELR